MVVFQVHQAFKRQEVKQTDSYVTQEILQVYCQVSWFLRGYQDPSWNAKSPPPLPPLWKGKQLWEQTETLSA